jgi:hypothetical protein
MCFKAIVGTNFDYPGASTIKARFPLLLSRLYGVSVDYALNKIVVAERDASACRGKAVPARAMRCKGVDRRSDWMTS